jgi:hypothetical protein
MPDFLPRREALLLQWAKNFDQRIHSAPEDYALTVEQADEFRAAFELFAGWYQLSRQPTTRTPSGLLAKDEAKAAMVRLTRALAGSVRGAMGVSDQLRFGLGLTVRRGRASRIGPPAAAPQVRVEPIVGRSAVRVRLVDAESPTRIAKPKGVMGATLFTLVSEQPPDASSQWVFSRNTTRTTAEIDFPHPLPPGAQVWVTTFWINPTSQRGPASAPVSTRVFGGWAMAA